MKTIEKLLKFGRLGNGTISEAILLWSAVIVFTHYILSAIILIVITSFILIRKDLRVTALQDSRLFIINCLISGLSLFSSLLSKNLIGCGISCGVFLVLILFGYLKSEIDEVGFRKYAVISMFGSIVFFVSAVVQKLIYRNANYRPTAGAFNANYYGALIVMVTLLALTRLFEKCEGSTENLWYMPTKAFYLFVVIINVVALFLSESRSSLLSIMVCIGIYLILKKKYMFCIVAGVLGVGVITVGWFHPELFSWTNSLSFVITERVDIWIDALRSFSRTPLNALIGRGPMTYFMVWESEGLCGANHAHNILVDALINVGIVGTLLYCVLFVHIFRSLTNTKRYYKMLITLFICQVCVQGIADVVIMWHQSAVLFITVAACAEIKKTKKVLYKESV